MFDEQLDKAGKINSVLIVLAIYGLLENADKKSISVKAPLSSPHGLQLQCEMQWAKQKRVELRGASTAPK